jgi:hypothetical protein
MEADLPELSGYTGEVLRDLAKDVVSEFYEEGGDWQHGFAGYLALRHEPEVAEENVVRMFG